jgi:hypothetical protein
MFSAAHIFCEGEKERCAAEKFIGGDALPRVETQGPERFNPGLNDVIPLGLERKSGRWLL